MNKNKKKFVLSDEQVNSYGFKVLTSGISLERFKKNPVMLFEHNRNEVIGKWTNVEVNGKELTAEPIFDQNDTQALTISKKVEGGFINGASIGINILEMDTSGEIPIAVKSELMETSIVTFPSNSNALTVVDKNGTALSSNEIYTTLSLKPNTINLQQQIGRALGLTVVTDTEILKEIKALKQKPVDDFIQKSLSEGRIMPNKKDFYTKVLSEDFNQGKEMIERMPKKVRLTDLIENEEKSFPIEWTLQDYRKHAPQHLRANKELFAELVEKNKQSKY